MYSPGTAGAKPGGGAGRPKSWARRTSWSEARSQFCVEYDKTHQNLTELGLIQFLLQEPARITRAADKCFYFQHDHWTGWIEEGGEPELYHWDGSYMIDMARGAVGGHVANFRIGGEPASPADYFTIPPAFDAYFGPGRSRWDPVRNTSPAALPAASRHTQGAEAGLRRPGS
jgi:hypothetical protein